MSAQAAFDVARRAIAAGPIPGAAAAVGRADAFEVSCVGVLEPDGAPATQSTWYDLASLTKVIATTSLLLRAIAGGLIDPRAPLREYVPEAAWMQPAPSLADITILELASHSSGLPAWQPLYTHGLTPDTLIARVLQTPLGPTRGSVLYSDLGFIVLGHLLERLDGTPLIEQVGAFLVDAGLSDGLAYGPIADAAAPTERCPWRGRLLRGEVHDENACALGGVSGHAGLFGTIDGVARFARAILAGGVVPSAVLDFAAHEWAEGPGAERRGFGWALASPGWPGGDIAGPRTLGHTGFTGTGLWIDLDSGRWAALLTNRVHPTRHGESGIQRLRRLFCQAAFA